MFCIDRLSRIYTAYLPALLIIFAINIWLVARGTLDPQYASIGSLLGNAAMLQMWYGPGELKDILAAANLAGPLWTVAIEWHIYMFVGAAWFLVQGTRSFAVIAFAIAFSFVPLRYLFADVQPGLGTALFALWLFGFSAYFVADRFSELPKYLLALAALVFGAIYLGAIKATVYDPGSYIWLAALLIATIALVGQTKYNVTMPRTAKAIRICANYSFSLYLLHYSILQVVQATTEMTVAVCIISIVCVNAVSYVFAYATEFN